MNPHIQFNEAIQAYQQGRLDDAEKILRELVQEIPGFPPAWSALGVVLIGKGQPDQAAIIIKEGLKKDPDNIDMLVNLSSAQIAFGQSGEAVASIRKALKLDPRRPDIHYNMGNILFQTNNYPEAVKSYQSAIALDPQLLSAQLNLGNLFLLTGDRNRARTAYKQLLINQPDVLPALINLGHILADEGLLEEAEIHYENAIKFHPKNVAALLVYSKHCLDTGNSAKAYTLLKTAAETDPNRADTFVLLGNAAKDIGLKDEAENYYKRALELEPGNHGALQNLRRLYSNIIPKWHFTMLADEARNKAYNQAIQKAVVNGSVVLDIGTGSGLLAMMAARAGAKSVIACEMHQKLAGVAQQVIKDNHFGNKIKVINKKSTDLKLGEDLPEPATVLISEILDVGAIGEGVVHVIRHASKSLLAKNAQIIPSSVKLFGQIIEIPERSKMSPVKNISGFDLSAFDIFRVPNEYISVNMASEKHRILSEVVPLITYDFYNLPSAIQDNQPVTKDIIFPVTASGMVQAVVFWFNLNLDENIMVTSKPGGDLQHWGQALFCFPESEGVSTGDKKIVKMIYSDHIIRFAF